MGSNKTIAKNTIFLYARMLFIMVVSLFTSRVVLQTLGVEDYGIFNVVGGLVTTLSFLTGAISAGTSRFYTYYIGKCDNQELTTYYRISLTCFIIISIIALVVGETLGLWFLNTQMQISPSRMIAANWVYQCALLSFLITMIGIPHQSMIISYEKMSVYAFVGIAEVLAKLLIVYVLVIGAIDKLILYSILNCCISISLVAFYIWYCKHNYEVCSFQINRNWQKIKEFLSYSLWIIFGALSNVFKDQGVNILLNIFFGATINAARGIAFQINRAIVQFVNNFYMAVRPQITKRYAAGDLDSMYSLVFSSSRMCFYLIFVLALPVLIQTPTVLGLWLHEVPDHTVLFTRLVLIAAIIESIAYPLDTSITSTGKIRGFQFVTGGLLLLNLPVSYVVLKMGGSAESTIYVMITLYIIAHISRMHFAKKHANVNLVKYTKDVLFRITIVTLLASAILITSYNIIAGYSDFLHLLIFTIACVIITCFIIYICGINSQERNFVNKFINNKILKR